MQDRMVLYIRPRKIEAARIEEVAEAVITAPQAEEDVMKEDDESPVGSHFVLQPILSLRRHFQQHNNL
jgi:hypothetical protein